MQDEILSIDEVGYLLQVHAETIHAWINRGLETVERDGEICIRRGDLEEFMRRENQGHVADATHAP